MTTVEQFRADYLATLPDDHPHHSATFDAWGFGDSPEMMDELGALVLNGPKRATASIVIEYEAEGEPIPPVGDISIILDGQENPLCIIETTEITIAPLNSVDTQFAWDEGEGDRTVAWWLDAHRRFFQRTCEANGWAFADDMDTVFERFRVIYPPENADE
ncbi:MAG: ASCH domain-containing protein [Chloroflexota bacterium]